MVYKSLCLLRDKEINPDFNRSAAVLKTRRAVQQRKEKKEIRSGCLQESGVS